MRELTEGDLRYINESTNSWQMLVDGIMNSMDNIPEEVTGHIGLLQEQYIEEFGEFFAAAVEAGTDKDADGLLGEFDNKWNTDHPEFYDMKALFSACSKEDLEKAADAIAWAESYIQ